MDSTTGLNPSRQELLRTQFIPRSREDVFAFFADAFNLELITPPFLNFGVLTTAPIELHRGTLIDYRLKLYGLKMRWQTRIECYEPPRRFSDLQLKGPYRYWHHRHEFEAVDGGTLMRDRVEYELPLGPLGMLAHGLLIRRTLNRIFDYRKATIAKLFSPTPVD